VGRRDVSTEYPATLTNLPSARRTERSSVNDGDQATDVCMESRFECIVLRGAARDMGPWSNPIGCDARGQSRDAQNVTAMNTRFVGQLERVRSVSRPASSSMTRVRCTVTSLDDSQLPDTRLLLLAKGARGKTSLL